jgi:hypothetical protein
MSDWSNAEKDRNGEGEETRTGEEQSGNGEVRKI